MPHSVISTYDPDHTGDPFVDFDPNETRKGQPVWAVFDGYKFKTYAQRGHAMNAVSHNRRMKLYEHVGGRWELRATKDVTNPPPACENCLQAWDVTDAAEKARVDAYNANVDAHNASIAAAGGPDYVRNLRRKYPIRFTPSRNWIFRRLGRKVVEPIELLCVCDPCKALVG